MRSELKINDAEISKIVEKLMNQEREALLSYRTDNRRDYELLLAAAREGRFPDLLSITRKGLRFNKRHVHAPPLSASAQG